LDYGQVWSFHSQIGGFSAFLDAHTALVAEFYGVIHVIEKAQKMGPTNL